VKYLKTKDAIAVIGSKLRIIGRDDPMYDNYLKVVNGEVSEDSIKILEGNFSCDLGDLAIEVDVEGDSAEIYRRGSYTKMPGDLYEWAKKTTKMNLAPSAVAKCIKSVMNSDVGLDGWMSILPSLKIDQEGRIKLQKKDEDEPEGALIDRGVSKAVFDYHDDEDIELFVRVLPEDVELDGEKMTAQRYFVEKRNT
jgi:hypothetical protein